MDEYPVGVRAIQPLLWIAAVVQGSIALMCTMLLDDVGGFIAETRMGVALPTTVFAISLFTAVLLIHSAMRLRGGRIPGGVDLFAAAWASLTPYSFIWAFEGDSEGAIFGNLTTSVCGLLILFIFLNIRERRLVYPGQTWGGEGPNATFANVPLLATQAIALLVLALGGFWVSGELTNEGEWSRFVAETRYSVVMIVIGLQALSMALLKPKSKRLAFLSGAVLLLALNVGAGAADMIEGRAAIFAWLAIVFCIISWSIAGLLALVDGKQMAWRKLS